MGSAFCDKLNNDEYISKKLYLKVLETNKNLIPNNFNLDDYNNIILEEKYRLYKDYFDNMYNGIDDNIKLDKEQIKAILADEDSSLIIAGAGTGKTTIISSKVKYLVDIKKIDPTKIIVMSYTKKATEELEKRINLDFGINANITTFHSLGYKYTKSLFFNRKCYVVDENTKNKIFLNYFKNYIFNDKEKIKEIIELFNTNELGSWVFGTFFKENYFKFKNFDDYFYAYKRKKLSEIRDLDITVTSMIEEMLNKEQIITIKGELVKSKGEALIANFLFCNNIDYEYEKLYPHMLESNKTYKPDFTLNLGGENIYIEYFGLSNYKADKLQRYEKIRKIKEDYHKKHHTKFIKLDYDYNQSLLLNLKEQLITMGFTLKPKNSIEIYFALLDQNPCAELFKFKNFLYRVISQIKSLEKREQYEDKIMQFIKETEKGTQEKLLKQYSYIKDFYFYYQKYLFGMEDYGFDFDDMLYYANKYTESLQKQANNEIEYMIIDEYQDISNERYLFLQNICNMCQAKIVAVGDDWQSIFSFAGSKIEYIYNFQRYFPNSKLLKITKTYRNSQQLIDYSGAFIMKNDSQIKKELTSNKKLDNPIKFVYFDDYEEYEVLKKLILKIHSEKPEHNILVLGRTNKVINQCYNDPQLLDSVGTKMEIVGYEDIDIDLMTIHKSKGLTADEVILIGLSRNFPSDYEEGFWIFKILKNPIPKEHIKFPEERRLFYVALTRTKNNVYLLINSNPKFRSEFIDELASIIG